MIDRATLHLFCGQLLGSALAAHFLGCKEQKHPDVTRSQEEDPRNKHRNVLNNDLISLKPLERLESFLQRRSGFAYLQIVSPT